MKNDALTCSIIGSIVLPLIGILALHYCGTQPLWLPLTGGGQQFNPSYLSFLFTTAIVGAFIGSVVAVMVRSTKLAYKDGAIGCITGSFVGSVFLYQTVGFLSYFSPIPVCMLGFSASALVLWAGLVKHKT